jgi:hypothetical protein
LGFHIVFDGGLLKKATALAKKRRVSGSGLFAQLLSEAIEE